MSDLSYLLLEYKTKVFVLYWLSFKDKNEDIEGLDENDPATADALAEFHFLESEMEGSGKFYTCLNANIRLN